MSTSTETQLPANAEADSSPRCAVSTGSLARDTPTSERMAFMLGWRHAEKGRARKPNPFDGIDEGLALMWDAGYHEGEPENK
jgi:hypothetical protein